MQTSFFSEEEGQGAKYQVLARKYRPQTFDDMIGQEVLVRTLTNAIKTDRVAHSFVLTGIRGVGKTTTARIIAKAMNCIGDENNKPTSSPCGKCVQCVSIAEGRSQDVLEMDAASHTGVNDVREIIENCRYKPVSSRFKIYIIDEVHMLSNSAFNALLKTLEEPPEHVKFIFATTEIRKIPITILSRCQRFDLKRVEVNDLQKHFNDVVEKEGFKAEENAIKLITNAAGGSVRDGLSILDQALALSEGELTEATVREMLGLSDTEHLYNLYEYILKGETKESLNLAKDLFSNGADPILILQDLLKINHTIAKLKSTDKNSELTDTELKRCKDLATKLSMSYLSRSWQVMLKGLEETKHAFDPIACFEMVLIRLVYMASIPSPEEVLRTMRSPQNMTPDNSNRQVAESDEKKNSPILIKSFPEILDILYKADEMMLYHHLRNDINFVKIEGTSLHLNISAVGVKGFTKKLGETLSKLSGNDWQIISSNEEGEATITEQNDKKEQNKISEITEHPHVKEVLNTFTDMEILDIKSKNTG